MPYNPWSGIQQAVFPTATPISVADVKSHTRTYAEADDSLLAGYISIATNRCQNKCRRAFMPQGWRFSLNQWPGRSPAAGYRESGSLDEYYRWNFIKVPYPPLRSITAFSYMDTNGNVYYMMQTFNVQVGNYLLDTSPDPGRVNLPFSGIWPNTILFPSSAITISFGCGYPAYSLTVNVDASGNATLPCSPLSISAVSPQIFVGQSSIWSATLTTTSDLTGWASGQTALFASITDPTWSSGGPDGLSRLYTIGAVNGGTGGGTIAITSSLSLINPSPLPFSASGSGTLMGVFDPAVVGTWVTLNVPPQGSPPSLSQSGSYNAVGISQDWTQLQLMLQQPTPIALPLTGGILTCNAVPMEIRSAIAFYTAHLYETREPIVTGRNETAVEIPGTIDEMLESYKYRETG